MCKKSKTSEKGSLTWNVS